MASYAMTIDERSAQGRALLTYLGTLNIKLQPLKKGKNHPTEEQKARLRQAYRDSQEGRVVSQETAHQMIDEFAQEQLAVAV